MVQNEVNQSMKTFQKSMVDTIEDMIDDCVESTLERMITEKSKKKNKVLSLIDIEISKKLKDQSTLKMIRDTVRKK